MPITETTRFSEVRIDHVPLVLSLQVTDSSDVNYNYSWQPGITFEDHDDADIRALRALYASADGLRDSAGNAITVQMRSGTTATVEDLPKLGLFNPLIAGAYDAFMNSGSINAAMGKEVAVGEDSTTGRPDFASTMGLVPADRVPDDGTMHQFLSDWYTQVVNPTLFHLRLQAGGLNSGGILDDPRAEAMARWLITKQTSGSTIDLTSVTSLSDLLIALNSNHRYTVEQSPGSTLVFAITSIGVGNTSLAFACDTSSGAEAIDVDAFNTLLDGAAVTLMDVTRAAEKVPFGSDIAHLTALRHGFDEGAYLEREGDWLTYRGKDYPDELDATNRPIHHTLLGGAYGRVFNVDALEEDSAGKKLLPNRWNVIGLYFDGTADLTLKIGMPQHLVPLAGNTWRVWVHNDAAAGSTAKMAIEDVNGVNIATLIAGEKIFLELTHRLNGTGEISTTTPFERRLSIHGDLETALDGNGYVSGITVAGNDHRGVVIPRATADQSDVQYHNDEAFTITASGAYASAADIATADLRVADDTFTVTKAGWLRIGLAVGINTANTGYIATGHGLNIYSQDGASPWAKTRVQTDLQRSLGTYSSRDYETVTELAVPDGGLILLPIFNYSAIASMPIGDMRVARYSLDLTLIQRVRHTY